MKNKIYTILILLIAILVGCKKEENNPALDLLNKAYKLANDNNEQAALLLLDSIHNAYPKDVKTRKMADTLMWKIELKQVENSLPYIDSVLLKINDTIPNLLKPFKHIKNEKFQNIGSFEHKQLKTENNTERCYLKPSTDEHGNFSLTSFYLGANAKHNYLRISVDDSFVETEIAPDANISRFVDIDMYREIIVFNDDLLNDAAKFIYSNQDKRIKITLEGYNQPYVYYLNKTEKKIIAQTYELSVVLSKYNQLTDQQLNVSQKIESLKRKLNM